MRGNPRRDDDPLEGAGSIPAGVGEPDEGDGVDDYDRVYPRGCGGTVKDALFAVNAAGLSPRVRGNRILEGVPYGTEGSIPAGAGEPWPRRQPSDPHRVYPRGCGGTL